MLAGYSYPTRSVEPDGTIALTVSLTDTVLDVIVVRFAVTWPSIQPLIVSPDAIRSINAENMASASACVCAKGIESINASVVFALNFIVSNPSSANA